MAENTGEIDLKKIVRRAKQSFSAPPPPDFVPVAYKDRTQDLETEVAMSPDEAQRAIVKFYVSLAPGVNPFSPETIALFREQIGSKIPDSMRVKDLMFDSKFLKAAHIKETDPSYYKELMSIRAVRSQLTRALNYSRHYAKKIPDFCRSSFLKRNILI